MSLDAFFKPRAVAVIGASADFTKMPGRPIQFLLRHGYTGGIYPVNPKYSDMNGLKCYAKVEDLPDGVDLALTAIASEKVAETVRQCAARGIKAVTILSGGFSESPLPEGAVRERELNQIAAQTGIRICGPNAQGGANLFDHVLATYTIAADRPQLIAGPVGLISQSGVFGGLIFATAQESRQGIGYCISTGNEVDVGFSECVRYIAQDPRINVIAGYIESIKDTGAEFIGALEVAAKHAKPVVLLKSGRTERGQSAAASHTGALASSDEGYAAVFRRTGVIRAQDDNDLRNLVAAFSAQRFPGGPRVAITSMSGGAGTLMTDQCAEAGLEVVTDLSADTTKRLKALLPPIAAVTNPIDVTAQMMVEPSLLAETATVLAEDDGVDIVMVFLGMSRAIQQPLIDHLELAYRATSKPILITWLAGDESVYSTLRGRGIPVFEDTFGCVRAAAGLLEYARFRQRYENARLSSTALEGIRGCGNEKVRALLNGAPQFMTEHDGKAILRSLSLPVPAGRLVRDRQDACGVARELGWPLALKLRGATIQHKSELGAVRLNISTFDALEQEFDALMSLLPDEADGVLIEAMSPPGIEIIVGTKSHPIFGPLVLVGLGGIFAEIYKDVSVRLAPVNVDEAQSMLEELVAYPILQGARGQAPADIEALKNIIVDVSRFADICAETVSEMDFNPIRVFQAGQGAMILDALIIKRSDDRIKTDITHQ